MELVSLEECTWNEYLTQSNTVNLFYLYQYNQSIAKSLNFQFLPYAVTEKGEVKAIMPVLYNKDAKILFSGYLGDYVSVYEQNDFLEDMINRIIIDFKEKRRNWKYMKITLNVNYALNLNCSYRYFPRYNFFIDCKELEYHDIFSDYSVSRRRNVKKLFKEGYTIITVNPSDEMSVLFYNFYLWTLKRNGTRPVFTQQFFQGLLKDLPDILQLNVVKDRSGKIVSMALDYFLPRIIGNFFLVSDTNYRNSSSNLLYDNLLKIGCREKKKVSLGLSDPNNNNFEFKRRFGLPILQLHDLYIFNDHISEMKVYLKQKIRMAGFHHSLVLKLFHIYKKIRCVI